MNEPTGSGDAFAVAAFLQRYLADRRSGRPMPLSAYLELFPDDRAAVSREYAALQEQGDAEAAADPAVPRQLGRYRIERELGRGGQGVVYLATDTKLSRQVALKVLTGLGALSSSALERFRREAETASRLDHPGICAVYDAGTIDHTPYLAMRHVAGETLGDKIHRARSEMSRGDSSGSGLRLSGSGAGSESVPTSDARASATRRVRREAQAVLKLFERAARALQHAHAAGVVHRDIKPGNLMVTPEGEPVILDFGLARDLEADTPTLTRSGEVFGTPAYMAPEQIERGAGAPDARTDVYALGVALYEALTLRPPFLARTREALYQAILTEEPPALRRLNTAVSRDLEVVLETALQKDPARRYASAELLADDLRAVLEDRPIAAVPVSRLERAWRWARRRPAHAALVVLLGLGLPTLVGVAGFLLEDLLEGQRIHARQEIDRELSRAVRDAVGALYERAEVRFEGVLDRDPDSVLAVAGLVFVQLCRRDPEAALARLSSSEQLVALHPILGQLRADALRMAGEESAAAGLEAELAELSGAEDLVVASLRQNFLIRITGGSDPMLALEYAKAAVRRHPGRPGRVYLTSLALWAYFSGDDRTLVELADRLEAEPQVDAQIWFARALTSYDLRRTAACYEESVALDPDSPASFWNLAGTLCARGEYRRVLGVLDDAEEDHGFVGFQSLWYRSIALAELGQREPTLDALRRARDLTPEDWRHDWVEALCRSALGEFQAAVPILESTVRCRPRFSYAWRLLGIARRRTGDFSGAIEALEGALEHASDYQRLLGFEEKAPIALWVRLELRRALVLSGEWDRAFEVGQQITGRWPEVARTPRPQDRDRDALELWQRADELPFGTDNAHTHLLHARAWLCSGQLDAACAAQRRAVELCVSAEQETRLGAVLLCCPGRATEAVEVFRSALERNPSWLDAQVGLARAYLELGEFDASVRAVNAALELDDDAPLAHALLGYALFRLGRDDEGLDSLAQAFELDPHPLEDCVWRWYVEALCALGRREEARILLETAADRMPRDPWGWDRLARLRLTLGECERANDAAWRAVGLTHRRGPEILLTLAEARARAGTFAEAAALAAQCEELVDGSDAPWQPVATIRAARQRYAAAAAAKR